MAEKASTSDGGYVEVSDQCVKFSRALDEEGREEHEVDMGNVYSVSFTRAGMLDEPGAFVVRDKDGKEHVAKVMEEDGKRLVAAVGAGEPADEPLLDDAEDQHEDVFDDDGGSQL